jgi:hypothetical protein
MKLGRPLGNVPYKLKKKLVITTVLYHCAFNAILSILFWSTCILSLCVCDAEFLTIVNI